MAEVFLSGLVRMLKPNVEHTLDFLLVWCNIAAMNCFCECLTLRESGPHGRRYKMPMQIRLGQLCAMCAVFYGRAPSLGSIEQRSDNSVQQDLATWSVLPYLLSAIGCECGPWSGLR